MKIKRLFSVLFSISSLACWAGETLSGEGVGGVQVPDDANRFDLFLLVGQSNMAGRGALTAADRQPDPRVLVLGKEDRWVLQGEPVHFDKPDIAGVGLGFTFARLVADGKPGMMVGLIPCAVGGTPISRWKPGGDLFEAAVRRAKLAMKQGRLRGILWHQGEAEASGITSSEAYKASLIAVAEGFRKALDQPEVPFIVGEIGQYTMEEGHVPKFPSARQINEAINALPSSVPYAAVVSSTGLGDKGDGLHFSSEALKELGKRYFEAWQSISQQGK
ncbi:MAG: sialate O-acetylesterase [Verrucomicrobia bacterium]|nr:sialate O-acetylesterase [Verrucomicrobiota bacterium]